MGLANLTYRPHQIKPSESKKEIETSLVLYYWDSRHLNNNQTKQNVLSHGKWSVYYRWCKVGTYLGASMSTYMNIGTLQSRDVIVSRKIKGHTNHDPRRSLQISTMLGACVFLSSIRLGVWYLLMSDFSICRKRFAMSDRFEWISCGKNVSFLIFFQGHISF